MHIRKTKALIQKLSGKNVVDEDGSSPRDEGGVIQDTSRRRFLQFTLAGSTSLVVGGAFLEPQSAEAAGIAIPELSNFFDAGDIAILMELPFAHSLVLEVRPDGRVYFELPRLEMGQGITTAIAMIIAEELGADYEKTDVVSSDRRSDRPFMLTGNSTTVRSLWGPVRQVASQARARLITAAALRWGVSPGSVSISGSRVFDSEGREASFGELSSEAANVTNLLVPATPKKLSEHEIVGTGRGRRNGRDIVTGRQAYTLDGHHPDALPAVVARSPDILGELVDFDDSVARGMSGVVDIVPITNGVAVIARTFHEAFLARDALETQWTPGPVAGRSDSDLREELDDASPDLGADYWLGRSHTAVFEFPYLSHAPMEVLAAVADVRPGQAEIWYASQVPNYLAGEIARKIGIPRKQVTLHVPFAGGSFGRRAFGEAAIDAAEASKAAGRPVKLMWSRNDDMRHGRFRPMARCAVKASWWGNWTYSFKHKITAAATNTESGMGDRLTSAVAKALPTGGLLQAGFQTSVSLPYRFGATKFQLTQRDFGVPTAAWRSVFSGMINTSNEIFIDEIAREQGWDEMEFRRRHLDSDSARRCLERVAEMGDWGRSMPAGHAQGVAVHMEYRSACAYLVEIDTTGDEPRLTRSYCAVDVGVPINTKGLSAQMEGMLIDAWSVMFLAGNHIDDGRVREGSYGDFLWARMNQAPITTEVHVFPASPNAKPGGAGELGFPAACAACVNAWARATGTVPRRFPIGEFA